MMMPWLISMLPKKILRKRNITVISVRIVVVLVSIAVLGTAKDIKCFLKKK
jgi:hypothetical protein